MPKITKLSDLKPDPKNANLGTERGRDMLRKSITDYGTGRSILVDKNGVIIAGNKTAEAAKEINHRKPIRVIQTKGDELIVVQRTDLDIGSKKARSLAIADNRVAELDLKWSPDILGTLDIDLGDFFKDSELRKIGMIRDTDEGPEAQIDRAAELQSKWKTERGQIWEIGKHRLMCGDSTMPPDAERLLDKQKPFICVTDPPYGVEYDANWRNEVERDNGAPYGGCAIGKVANDDQVDWSKAFNNFPGDVFYCWHAGVHATEVQRSIESCGFAIRSQIIWNKDRFVISRGDYHWQHEPCWYAVRKGKGSQWAGDRSQTTVWNIGHQKSETGHSTQKPVQAMSIPIQNHRGDVYDPFCGSGTTLVAAEQLDRRCFAVEIDPGYVAVAIERMSDMGLKPKLAKS
jgi:DNA modification methylase